jgi:hypothetical protein
MRMTPAQSILTAYKAGLTDGRVEIPQYQPQTRSDELQPESEAALYFQSLLTSSTPEPRPVIGPRVPPRLWHPDPLRADTDIAAHITHRHPALDFAFEDAALLQIGRSMSGSSWGRRGRFPSLKSQRMLRAASRGERENFLHNELDTQVTTFVEQPVRLCYRDQQGKPRYYRPDCLVVRNGTFEFQEVKLEEDAKREENDVRWKVIGPAFNSLGFGFRVLTELQLRREPLWSNIKTIWRDRLAPIPPSTLLDSVEAKLVEAKSLTISEILDRFPNIQRKQLYALVRRGFLEIELASEVLGADTHVRLGRGLMSTTRFREE